MPSSYDDEPAGQTDPQLADFSVAHDEPYVLPALRAAQQLNPRVYLEGVPWSAPGWMKANGALDNQAYAGTLLPRDDAAFARYLAAFVRAYRERGVRVKALAVQDEPDEPNPYPGMQISTSQEADLVARYIRPALRSAGLSVNAFGWDLSWGPVKAVAPLIGDTENGALSGLAWHSRTDFRSSCPAHTRPARTLCRPSCALATQRPLGRPPPLRRRDRTT